MLVREADRIRGLVERSRKVLVMSHKDADGDTLGSALAMVDVMRAMGKDPAIRVPKPVPELYSFLPGYDAVNQERSGWHPDLVIVMDASNLDRLSDLMTDIEEGTPIVNIDHHVSNDRFGQVNLVVVEASSTAEVAYDLLRQWEVEITPAVATNLYTGVLTDTGGFRHENTTYKALQVAAELVECGADPADIATQVYKRRKLSTLKLQAMVMGTIRFECDDRLVYAYVSQEELRQAGATTEESEGIIDLLNSVDGLDLALLFKEIAPSLTKVSVRSREPVNANEVAALFGGGGHERAAGAEIPLPLQDAMAGFLAEARRVILAEAPRQ
jgi:phosphoesterase RecJ-like protein